MKKMRVSSLLLFICAGSLFFGQLLHAEPTAEAQRKRNLMIAYMLSKQLPGLHYSNKALDNSLGEAAFSLYIKQLDYQKRFLLQSDVKALEGFADFIDDNMKDGRITLPDAGYAMLSERISQVKKIVDDVLAAGLDSAPGEVYEGDPEKLSYVEDLVGLKDRWYKILKAQVMSKFLDLKEEAVAANKEKKIIADPDSVKLWQEATDKVAKQNRSFLHRLTQETLQDHYDRFFNSVARAYGPHTNYIAPASKEQFDIQMRGSLEGIGAMLREEDGIIKVVSIVPGSASARQGQLQAEDTILGVAQGEDEPVDVTDMRLSEAVRLIRGEKGSEVRLSVRKTDGAKVIIPIIRDVVQMEDTFVKSTIIDAKNGLKIGYVSIPSFYRDFEKSKNGQAGRNCTDDTRVEVLKLTKLGVNGIVIDLRNDGGGALIDSVDIVGLFIKDGPVVQVRTSTEDTRVLSDEDSSLIYDGPLVVLVNKFSASASEIVAAALQDYGRAIILGGSHTHGKGTVQTILNLNDYVPWLSKNDYEDLGALKITIQKFYRVNGGSTQYKGVEPDVVLPDLYDYLKSGERNLEYSLPWDSIGAVDYTPFDNNLDVAQIRANSLKRVQKDKEFAVIKDEAAKAEQRSLDSVIYLDLKKMEQERVVAKEARKRIGTGMHTFDDEETDDQAVVQEKNSIEKEKSWREGIEGDPYVAEAGNIISDIIKLKQ